MRETPVPFGVSNYFDGADDVQMICAWQQDPIE